MTLFNLYRIYEILLRPSQTTPFALGTKTKMQKENTGMLTYIDNRHIYTQLHITVKDMS